MVQKAVEDRGGEDLVAEDLAPLTEGLVGQDDRALLVAFGNAPEDRFLMRSYSPPPTTTYRDSRLCAAIVDRLASPRAHIDEDTVTDRVIPVVRLTRRVGTR